MSNASERHALTHLVPRPPIVGVPFDPRAAEGAQDEPSFAVKGYLRTLYDSRGLIGWITAGITFVAVLYALVAAPVFETNMMIHVEEESPNASKNILSEASSLFETKKAAIAHGRVARGRQLAAVYRRAPEILPHRGILVRQSERRRPVGTRAVRLWWLRLG
jgi:tyrosine-protein kinase Etk/Wzc